MRLARDRLLHLSQLISIEDVSLSVRGLMSSLPTCGFDLPSQAVRSVGALVFTRGGFLQATSLVKGLEVGLREHGYSERMLQRCSDHSPSFASISAIMSATYCPSGVERAGEQT